MLKSKKVRKYTAKELGIWVRDLTVARDSLYRDSLLDKTEYADLTRAINSLTSAKLRISFKEANRQGTLI